MTVLETFAYLAKSTDAVKKCRYIYNIYIYNIMKLYPTTNNDVVIRNHYS